MVHEDEEEEPTPIIRPPEDWEPPRRLDTKEEFLQYAQWKVPEGVTIVDHEDGCGVSWETEEGYLTIGIPFRPGDLSTRVALFIKVALRGIQKTLMMKELPLIPGVLEDELEYLKFQGER